jgi:hypothetical protein
VAKKEHLFHQVASELSDWLGETSKELAFGLHDGDRPPFAADVGDNERLDYYENKLFNPDGTPNEQGRQAEIARIGPAGYAQVLLALTKRRGQPFPSIPGQVALPTQAPQEGQDD